MADHPAAYPTASAFASRAVADRLADEEAPQMLLGMLREVAGEPTADDRAWADDALRLADQMAVEPAAIHGCGMNRGFALDTRALVALEHRSSQRRLTALFEALAEHGQLILSAGALAEAWRGARRQISLALLLRRRATTVVEITTPIAKTIGVSSDDTQMTIWSTLTS